MHNFSEGDIDTIVNPTVLFTYTNEIKITELADADTKLTENHQYNGSMTLLVTQPYSPHSPLTDTLFALAEPPPRPRVEAGEAAVLVRAG